MSSLTIREEDIPSLAGKVSLITGGSSGIGLATAKLFALRGARVHVLDRNQIPADDSTPSGDNISFHACDITDWHALRGVFDTIGHVDIVVANAGVSQETDYFADTLDEAGKLQEPRYGVLDVNMRATINVVKLTLRAFRQQFGPGKVAKDSINGTENCSGQALHDGGSLVVTCSATAYAPELALPVYSASKLAQIGLIRALRPQLPYSQYGNSTINGVAPAATITALLPMDLAGPIMAAGLPVSNAHHVALAIAHSATARQDRQVEGYGRDPPERVTGPGRWNGRIILTLGESWTEIEGPLADARTQWMGKYATEMTAFQQSVTDPRGVVAANASAKTSNE